jgi:hypothetical protein
MMYLSNMVDPDLVIRAAHRLLDTRRLPSFSTAALLAQLQEVFRLAAARAAARRAEASP